MSNDVRSLLHNAATKPSSAADVAGAWRRGRRMRAQRLAVSGLAVVAIVAIAGLAAVTVLPDNGDSPRPVPPATNGPAQCVALSTANDIPAWADSANPPSGVPHFASADGNVVAVVFPHTLQAGTRVDGQNNKILFIVRQARDGQPLHITGTLPESVRTVQAEEPADSSPGEIYPSVINVPAPGCWHFALEWNGHTSKIDLAYAPAAAPATTTSTEPTTTTSTTAPTVTGTTCRTTNLTLTISDPSGAAGSMGYEIAFKNNGASTCTMDGYPGVSFLDASGNQIGVPAARNQMEHTPVSVAPGAIVYSLLIVGNPDVYNCPVATPQKIRVFPPNETELALIDAIGVRTCANQAANSFVNPVVSEPNF